MPAQKKGFVGVVMTLGLILFGASRHLDPLWANRVCGVLGILWMLSHSACLALALPVFLTGAMPALGLLIHPWGRSPFWIEVSIPVFPPP